MAEAGGWQLCEHVGVVRREGMTYLADFPDGPILVLDAVASVILEAALAVPAVELSAAVAAAYDIDVTEVDDAVRGCLADLAGQGLVVLR